MLSQATVDTPEPNSRRPSTASEIRRTKSKTTLDRPVGAERTNGTVEEDHSDVRREVQRLRIYFDASVEQVRAQVHDLAEETREHIKRISASVDSQGAGVQADIRTLREGLNVEIAALVTEAVGAEFERVRSSVMRDAVAGAVEGARTLLSSPASPPTRQSCGDLEQLQQRAEKAELELRVARSEMELKAVRPELELRVIRAEQDLRETREKAERQQALRTQVPPQLQPQPQTAAAPLEQDTDPMVVLGRYEVYQDDILGQGGFSIVRRGYDRQTGDTVAVKTYYDMEKSSVEDHAWLLAKFIHEVTIFQRLHSKDDMKDNIMKQKQAQKTKKRSSWYIPEGLDDNGGPLMNAFLDIPDPGDLFVRLIDYSKDVNGQPGPRPGDHGVCYIVLELADYTLHEYLDGRNVSGMYLGKSEVFHLFRQLAQILIVLHSKQFVHADLKPLNIMHFPSGHWKLIDMDGMVWPGSATACDVCYTPYYCAPEIAVQFAKQLEEVTTSRLLDVWSLGMCVCELITMSPVLEAAYNQLLAIYSDYNAFLFWLADPNVRIEVPTRVRSLDPQLADLLEGMLQKNPEMRMSMVEVMVHPYFTGSAAGGNWACMEKSYLYTHGAAAQYVREMTVGVGVKLGLVDEQRRDSQPQAGGHPTRRLSGPLDKRLLDQLQQTHRMRVSACHVAADAAPATAAQGDETPQSRLSMIEEHE